MKSKDKKIIIIGAGITGAVVARKLAEEGYSVFVYEKRDHIGGNMYDYEKDGILVHKYGSHIFIFQKKMFMNVCLNFEN